MFAPGRVGGLLVRQQGGDGLDGVADVVAPAKVAGVPQQSFHHVGCRNEQGLVVRACDRSHAERRAVPGVADRHCEMASRCVV